MESEAIIPWSGRLTSQSEGVNFLIKTNNIYFTDNHRLTPWILANELSDHQSYNYFHIDAHEDANLGLIEKAPLHWKELTLPEFMDQKDMQYNCALFRWDNYLPLIFKEFRFRRRVAATHQIGIAGDFHQWHRSEQLFRGLQSIFTDELQWVINIDLDYFYARDYKQEPFINENYIKACFELIKKHNELGDIKTIIVALSPECCGGWPQAEHLLELFTQSFGMPKLEPSTKLA